MPGKNWLLGVLVAGGLAACGFQAELELKLSFQPLGGAPLDCATAGVETVVVQLLESLDGPPDSTITQPCREWRNQELLVAPGDLFVRVQGLNAEGAICYEDTRDVTLTRRDSLAVEWVVIQNGGGVDAGCVYP